MITKSTGYQSSDGAFHNTLEDAQKAEVCSFFKEVEGDAPWTPNEISNQILAFKDKIIDILTMKPNSLPKARKINGGKKPRKHIAEQTTMFNAETPKPAA